MSNNRKKPVVLVVDDEFSFHNNLVFSFGEYNLISVYKLDSAYPILEAVNLDLVILDVELDSNEVRRYRGVQLLEEIKAQRPELPVVIVTSHQGRKDFPQKLCFDKADKLLTKDEYNRNNWKQIFDDLMFDGESLKKKPITDFAY
ncbi:MAG: response regulator [Bacteroidota bacterium]